MTIATDGAKRKCLQRFLSVPLALLSALLLSATLSWAPNSAQADGKNLADWQQDQMVVNHSIEKVESLLSKCADYKDLFKYVTISRPISTDQCYIEALIVRHRAWIKLKMGKRRVDADGKTVRYTAAMLDGNVDEFDVRIKLIKLEDRKTQIIIRMQADPGLPVPNSLVEGHVKKVLHRALVKLSMRLLVGRY